MYMIRLKPNGNTSVYAFTLEDLETSTDECHLETINVFLLFLL